jgi:hypothetical protein
MALLLFTYVASVSVCRTRTLGRGFVEKLYSSSVRDQVSGRCCVDG